MDSLVVFSDHIVRMRWSIWQYFQSILLVRGSSFLTVFTFLSTFHFLVILSTTNLHSLQGWELALRFFVQKARFLRAKELFALLKEPIAFFTRFVKSDYLFFKERGERWRVIHSFVLVIKRGNAWCIEQIWNKSLLRRVNQSFIKSELLTSLFT